MDGVFSNQDVPSFLQLRCKLQKQRTQPPLRTIAFYGITDFFSGGKTNTSISLFFQIKKNTRAGVLTLASFVNKLKLTIVFQQVKIG